MVHPNSIAHQVIVDIGDGYFSGEESMRRANYNKVMSALVISLVVAFLLRST